MWENVLSSPVKVALLGGTEDVFSLSPGYICLYYIILPRAVSGPWNYLFLVCREKH